MIKLVCADKACAHTTDACFDDGLHPGEDWCQFCGDWCMVDGVGCAEYVRWIEGADGNAGWESP